MASAVNVTVLIHLIAACLNDFCGDRQVTTRKDDTVKGEFEIALADEMTWLFVGFQMSTKHTAPWEQRLAELLHRSQVTQHWIADCGSSGRKIRLVHGALQKRSGRHKKVLGVDPLCQHQ